MAGYHLSDAEYKDICALVYQHTGILLTEEKRKLAYARFSKRLTALKLTSFRDYCALIKNNDQAELVNFTNAITTNLTSFFREPHHFERLREHIMPALMAGTAKKIRIWSAGCSSGEEPYSIAITLLKAFPDISSRDIKILATDVDSGMLGTAARGIYSARAVSGLEASMLSEWFTAGTLHGAKAYKVNPPARNLIAFKKLNLMDQLWPMRGRFDVIFCRNVLIYFDRGTQAGLFKRFSMLQNAGDHLIIGHSETIKGLSADYKNTGRTTYVKIA